MRQIGFPATSASRHRHFLAAIFLAPFLLVCARSAGVSEEKFRELQSQLAPAPDEPWRTIPWQIALLDAQRQAARERKPIFIWAMDGHPLGCT